MIAEGKRFACLDLRPETEEQIRFAVGRLRGTLAFHVSADTDVVIYSPGEGEKLPGYRQAKDMQVQTARAGSEIRPVLMTPALFFMLAEGQSFDPVPRNDKAVAAMGYMRGEPVWEEVSGDIERFLKYEHESILDRAYLKDENEYIYTLFEWLAGSEEAWIREGYSDKAYLRDLAGKYAQRAIDDDKQDLTSYFLDYKERLTDGTKPVANTGAGGASPIDDALEADDPFADFALEDYAPSGAHSAGEDETDGAGGEGDADALPVYYSCGREITMGEYKMAAGGTPGPVTWTVIGREDDKALLLTKQVIEIMPFNDFYDNMSWENCSLRQWLDDTFYENAFTDAEKERIIPARLTNGKGAGIYGAVPEEIYHDTFDRVFLLSADEVKLYLIGSGWIKAGPTDYVKAKNVSSAISGNYRWWGRSMGINGSSACVVDYSWVNGYGENINSGGIGVRPAMWIRIPG